MAGKNDPRLLEARAIPIFEIAGRLGVDGLVPVGAERVGPCPVCGGRDRFGIHTRDGVWNCRHCGGGDGIKLVEHVLGCDFRAALAWLVGEAAAAPDPEEMARRRRDAERRARADRARAERAREQAIAAARNVWRQGEPAEATGVRHYLHRRGLTSSMLPDLPKCLRWHPSLPYMAPDGSGGWHEMFRGPAMLAAVQGPDGRFIGVHRTWLDDGAPKGKARIEGPDGPLPAKKVQGSKKGGAIRLVTPAGAVRLVMGEGIETTLTAAAAGVWPGTACWAGVDLGNMAGRRVLRGKGMKYAGVPDLEDSNAFLPPGWVQHLVFIQDGDSEPRATRAKLLAGLRRARAKVASVRRVSIVHAGEGRDLNDALMAEGEE